MIEPQQEVIEALSRIRRAQAPALADSIQILPGEHHYHNGMVERHVVQMVWSDAPRIAGTQVMRVIVLHPKNLCRCEDVHWCDA